MNFIYTNPVPFHLSTEWYLRDDVFIRPPNTKMSHITDSGPLDPNVSPNAIKYGVEDGPPDSLSKRSVRGTW